MWIVAATDRMAGTDHSIVLGTDHSIVLETDQKAGLEIGPEIGLETVAIVLGHGRAVVEGDQTVAIEHRAGFLIDFLSLWLGAWTVNLTTNFSGVPARLLILGRLRANC